MPEPSGPQSPEPFAIFDPDLCCWKTSRPSFPLESWDEPSPIWPRSGTWDRGAAYERPTSAHPTAATAASSLLVLLETPTAQLAVNGGSQHPDKRKAGGHGPTLDDEVTHLLPTPRTNSGGPDNSSMRPSGQKGTVNLAGALLPTPTTQPTTSNGHARNLSKEMQLLPTPTATAYGSNQSASAGAAVRPSLNSLAPTLLPTPTVGDSRNSRNSTATRTADSKHHAGTTLSDLYGAPTDQPWTAGPPSSDAPHQTPPLWDDEADGS